MYEQDPHSFSLDPNNAQDAELIEFFVSELPERVSTLNTAIESEDFDAIKRLAHQLKGAAPGYGFPKIGSAAASLEQSINATTDRTINEIQSELDALIRLCESYTRET